MFSPKRIFRRSGQRRNFAVSRRRGTLTVEMAMVVPAIFLMVFGSIEFARMMMVRQALTNTAREACRHACLVTTQQSSACEAVARRSLRGIIKHSSDTADLYIKIDPAFSSPPETGATIIATVEIDCADVSWLPPFFTAGARISATSKMSRE